MVLRLCRGGGQFAGNEVEVVIERTQRLVIEAAAGQHKGSGADGGGQREQCLEMTVPIGTSWISAISL